jgi:hypothetical protein
VSLLAGRLLDVHDALELARLPHAFGGAIALAYCTEDPRGTHDLDVNVFVEPDRADEVFAAMPSGVATGPGDLEAVQRDGQVRLWWEDTPVDLFLDVLDFHREVSRNVRWVPFEGRTIPVIGCAALAVFKALIDRTKDWADIEAMIEGGELDVAEAMVSLQGILDPDHPSVRRLGSLVA